MFTQLINFDISVSQFIASFIPHNSFFNYFFSFLSMKGYSVFIWIVIIVVLLFIEEKRDKKKHFIIYFVVAFLISGLLVTFVIKNVFHRQRPVIHSKTYFTCPADYSFPSSHAATAFSAALILSAYDKKRRTFYYLIAALISLSRIYLECHYLLDVIAGGIIGSGISRLILYLPGKYFFKTRLPE